MSTSSLQQLNENIFEDMSILNHKSMKYFWGVLTYSVFVPLVFFFQKCRLCSLQSDITHIIPDYFFDTEWLYDTSGTSDTTLKIMGKYFALICNVLVVA